MEPQIENKPPEEVTQQPINPTPPVIAEPEPVQPPVTVTAPEIVPEVPVTPLIAPKKSKKMLITIIVIVVALIVTAAGIYLYITMTNKTDTAANVQTSDTSSTPKSSSTTDTNQPITKVSLDAVTKILTDGYSSEATITNTDDSSYATAANTSAGKVGGSISENNF